MDRSLAAMIALLAALALMPACAAAPSSPPVLQFDRAPVATDVDPWVNWPRRPITTLQQRIDDDRARLQILEMEGAGSGVTGAFKAKLQSPVTGEMIKVKAKAVPEHLDHFNNSPRREIAAYTMQALFLNPVDYVVPSSTLRCIPLVEWRAHAGTGEPSVPGTRCVLVNLSMWLSDVEVPDRVYDPERFVRDANYAYYLGNLNILTYLIQARDTRRGNILASTHQADRKVFAVDNGISFGVLIFNWFYPPTYHWQQLRVPSLPRDAIDKLRKLERADLDGLATVIELDADAEGILRVHAPGQPFDPDEGVRVQGTRVQFGLTRAEIDAVWTRLGHLLSEVEAGRIGLF